MPKAKKRIFIVEDEKFSINFYQTRLIAGGYDVSVTPRAKDALRMIKNKKPNLIIIDLMLQDGNGFDLIEEIRKEKIKTPIIVLSNLGQDEDINEAIKKGATKYFVKSNTQFSEIEKEIKKIIK